VFEEKADLDPDVPLGFSKDDVVKAYIAKKEEQVILMPTLMEDCKDTPD
jgi:hypothetical protein